jgi:hypothetical protein
MLDYSIRGSLAPSISPEFYSWTSWRGGRLAWYQSRGLGFNSSGHAIFRCMYSTLTSVRWAHRHGRTNNHGSHAGEGMLDYSIRCLLTPSISPGFYGWTG